MRRLRYLLVLLVALDFFDPGDGLFPGMFHSDGAAAQVLPIPSVPGPYDPSQALATFNTLINQINGVLVPALGATVTSAGTAVNTIALTGGVTGNSAVIGLQPGADANAGILIRPNGSGNLTLLGLSGTGVVQFGNQASFVSAPSLTACSTPGLAAIQGVKSTVQGMLIVKDWLGVARGLQAC
jgi:hypothetical protein